MSKQNYTFDDFSGGQQSASARGRIPRNAARVMRNLWNRDDGKLVDTPAPADLYTIPGGLVTRTAFRYFGADGQTYLIHTTYGLVGDVYSTTVSAVRESDSSGIVIAGVTPTISVDLSNSGYTNAEDLKEVRYVQEGDALFFTIPGGPLMVWYGDFTAGTARPAGLPVPTLAPSITVNSGGNLTSIGKPSPFYYKYTLGYEGVESNPSDAAGPFDVDDANIDVEVYKAGPSPDVDPDVAYIYRLGGDITDDYYRVGELALAPGGGTFTFNDDLAEVNVGTIQIPKNNFQPPEGSNIIASHNNRIMIGSSVGSEDTESPINLFVSGFQRYETFGQQIQDPTGRDGTVLVLPGGRGDRLLSVTSVGSIAIIGRSKSVWGLYGNSAKVGASNQFAFSQRANVGIASEDAMCRGYNEAYFAGTDRRIYALGESNPVWISRPIHDKLNKDAMTDANYKTVKLAFHDGQLIVGFETGPAVPNDISFVFDIETGTWREETELFSRCLFGQRPKDLTNDSLPDELLFVNPAGTKIRKAFSDSAPERYVWWKSPEVEHTADHVEGKTESTPSWVEIFGVIDNGDTGDKAVVVVNSGTLSGNYAIGGNEWDSGYNSSDRVIASFRPAVNLVGMFNSVEIKGYVDSIELEATTLSLDIVRAEG